MIRAEDACRTFLSLLTQAIADIEDDSVRCRAEQAEIKAFQAMRQEGLSRLVVDGHEFRDAASGLRYPDRDGPWYLTVTQV